MTMDEPVQIKEKKKEKGIPLSTLLGGLFFGAVGVILGKYLNKGQRIKIPRITISQTMRRYWSATEGFRKPLYVVIIGWLVIRTSPLLWDLMDVYYAYPNYYETTILYFVYIALPTIIVGIISNILRRERKVVLRWIGILGLLSTLLSVGCFLALTIKGLIAA